jgi:hypothetical protein
MRTEIRPADLRAQIAGLTAERDARHAGSAATCPQPPAGRNARSGARLLPGCPEPPGRQPALRATGSMAGCGTGDHRACAVRDRPG